MKREWITNTSTEYLKTREGIRLLTWDRTVGDPRAAEAYTVKQLKDMGMVGIYETVGEDTAEPNPFAHLIPPAEKEK